jgi:hypothetical protein
MNEIVCLKLALGRLVYPRGHVRLDRSGRVAQLVEQRPFNAWVAGSNPAALTIEINELAVVTRTASTHDSHAWVPVPGRFLLPARNMAAKTCSCAFSLLPSTLFAYS